MEFIVQNNVAHFYGSYEQHNITNKPAQQKVIQTVHSELKVYRLSEYCQQQEQHIFNSYFVASELTFAFLL